ncbi:MAG: hypothetical protein RSA41_07055 [Christensenella sp.]
MSKQEIGELIEELIRIKDEYRAVMTRQEADTISDACNALERAQ